MTSLSYLSSYPILIALPEIMGKLSIDSLPWMIDPEIKRIYGNKPFDRLFEMGPEKSGVTGWTRLEPV